MHYKVGDKVYVTDEELEGEVISVSADRVTIVCDDGFEYEYLTTQLFKLNHDNSIAFSTKEYKVKEDQNLEQTEFVIPRKIEFVGDKPVFDLHIEVLAPEEPFVGPHDKLLFQLNYVRDVLFEASRKRIKRMDFVHGVGKGKLREELRKMLKESYPRVEFFDGDYNSFGIGATEIIIHQF